MPPTARRRSRHLEGDDQPDAVILDILMPGVDGLEVCRRLRSAGNEVPVLMLTARAEVDSRVAGLDAGADDYLPKPFALAELLARLRALLRRTAGDSTDAVRFADLELDPGTREVRRAGHLIELTRTEFSLLELFLRNPRQVLTRSIIFERVWGFDFGPSSNSLDVYIGYLRRKTEAGRRVAPHPHRARCGVRVARGMSFRARIAIAAAGAVALAVVLASILVFFVVRDQLRTQIDEALESRAEQIAHIPIHEFESSSGETYVTLLRPGFGEPASSMQVVKADGEILRTPVDDVKLPVPDAAIAVARGDAAGYFSDAHVSDTHVRILTFQYSPGYAVQVARPLTEVDESLGRLRTFLILIAVSGIGAAAALGLVVSRAALAPVRRLTDTAERVTKTGDLSERIDVSGRDELSSLASSFNSMLAALEDSTRAQRQLVADASHELRTPLTSLRTNIEVLASDRALPPEERRRLLSDVVEQLGEMTSLIAELIELARTEQQTVEPEDVRLDLAAAEALERARRNHPEISFSSSLDESTVHGVPATIERAIGNLLDNAAKWSPAGCRGRAGRARRRGERSRPWAGNRGGRSSVCLRPLLPRALGARTARIRPRTRHRAAGSRGTRRRRGRGASRGWWNEHDPALQRSRRRRREPLLATS